MTGLPLLLFRLHSIASVFALTSARVEAGLLLTESEMETLDLPTLFWLSESLFSITVLEVLSFGEIEVNWDELPEAGCVLDVAGFESPECEDSLVAWMGMRSDGGLSFCGDKGLITSTVGELVALRPSHFFVTEDSTSGVGGWDSSQLSL